MLQTPTICFVPLLRRFLSPSFMTFWRTCGVLLISSNLRIMRCLKPSKLVTGVKKCKFGDKVKEKSHRESRHRNVAARGFLTSRLSKTSLKKSGVSSENESFKQMVLEPRLVVYEIINEDGQVMFKHAWKTVVKYSNIWLPILCGILTTYFTWIMVYLDSQVPGVQPPSPFSPGKYKTRSGHSFHLNYVFAVLIGALVAVYMYWRQINIEY